MKKIFLASSFKDVSNLFSEFEKNYEGKTVTFIPTASKVEKVVFYVESAKKEFEKLGITIDILDISESSQEQINSKLRSNDYIYISGGNSFYLLHELKRTGADKIIIEEVNAGKLYIGESAGSIITSANIEYIKAMDSYKKAPDLIDFDALNLVDFYTVPHVNNFPFKKSAQQIINTYSKELPLAPISNNEAILVIGNEITIKKN